MAEQKECLICCRGRMSWVTCPKCQFTCCMNCTKTYLLELVDTVPKCMNPECGVTWSFEFVAKNTDDKFHNQEYRNRRAQLMIERERSLLPGTQPLVVEEKRRREIKEKMDVKINKYTGNLGQLRQEKSLTLMDHHLTKIEREQKLFHIRNKIKNIKSKLATCRKMKSEKKSVDKITQRFIGHCPEEDCRGFLDNKYVCGLCENKACRSCRQQQHEGDCDKDAVETVKLLARDTKPCPSCSVPIFKISGCSQMWCTECHTPFDWKTGQIVDGVIHNPHFYQFQRQANNGRAPRARGDIRCGGLVSINDLCRKLIYLKFDSETINWITRAHGLANHLQHVVLNNYPNRQPGEDNYERQRVKFLIGDMNEKQWHREIKRLEKKREKDRAIHMILRMFIDTLSDLLSNIVVASEEHVVLVIGEMIQLCAYTRENLASIGERFKNKVPILEPNWKFIDLRNQVYNETKKITY